MLTGLSYLEDHREAISIGVAGGAFAHEPQALLQPNRLHALCICTCAIGINIGVGFATLTLIGRNNWAGRTCIG